MKMLITDCKRVVCCASEIIEDNIRKAFFVPGVNTLYPYSLNLTLLHVNEAPSDYKNNRYLFDNGKFELNPNYIEESTLEDQVKAQQKQIEELTLTILSMEV